MERLLTALRAAGESTRLRLLALLSRTDLTVSELTGILGQSQPRVSRHLKLLSDAGLIRRYQEGTWAFYRIADSGPQAEVARTLVGWISDDDPAIASDLRRLEAVRNNRRKAAAGYFRRIAGDWDQIRSLYVDEDQVEQAMLELADGESIGEHLDLGTGTGRVLEIFSEQADRGLGIDSSREMLAIARAKLEEVGAANCHVRHGDIYNLPLPTGSVDLVTIHQVLHFLDDPAAALAEAARTLRPRGRLILVDFSPHQLEFLRSDFAHRRLGFSDEEITQWCKAAGLTDISVRHLRCASGTPGKQLTVSVWSALQDRDAPSHHRLEVA